MKAWLNDMFPYDERIFDEEPDDEEVYEEEIYEECLDPFQCGAPFYDSEVGYTSDLCASCQERPAT